MKKKLLKVLSVFLGLLLLVSCSRSGNVAGQDDSDWPKKDINLYITHAAGGDTDYMARKLASLLEKKLNVSVVASNVTGANGSTCMQQYKDGPSDGYTFLATNTSALTGNEVTGVSDFGYDAFEPVSVYGIQSGENIVVSGDSPYDSLSDLIEASKQNPGKIKFGTSTGGGAYIMTLALNNIGKAEFNIIDAGDAANRLTALLSGEVDATFLPYSNIIDYLETKQIKSLATALSSPPTLLKDQKVASETVKEIKLDTEYAILAPKGTDSEVVKKLNDAILEVTKSDEWKKIVNDFSFQDPFVLNVEETKKNLEEQRTLFQGFKPFLEK